MRSEDRIYRRQPEREAFIDANVVRRTLIEGVEK
jgi:hypothetical protein